MSAARDFRARTGVSCLSAVVGVRCVGLTEAEYVGIYVPVALSTLLLPALVMRAWHRPEAALLFLAMEIVAAVAVSTWDLVFRFDPPGPRMYEVADIALGITSSLPVLFILLTATSIYLFLLRPSLPPILRATPSTAIFVVAFLPLVPLGFIASLLGSVLLLEYQTDRTRRGTVIGFANAEDEWWNTVLTAAGAIAITAYTLLLTTLTQLTLFRPASFARFSSNTTTAHTATSILSCLALGLLLAAIQNGLTLAPTSFALLIARQVVLLVSRTLLTAGLYLAYPPSPAPRSGGVWRNLSNGETGSALTGPTQSAGAGGPGAGGLELGAGGIGGRSGAAWNTWEEEKPADQGEVQEGGWLARGLSRKREKSTKSGKTSSNKAARTKLLIGAPVTDTFKRLSTGGTREFHAHKMGEKLLSEAAVVPGTAAPAPAPVERVVFRTPPARAPILSFTSSLFTSASLDALANIRGSFTGSPASVSGSRPPSPSGAGAGASGDVRDRTAPSAWHPFARPVPGRRRSRVGGSGKTKKYIGSIYSPSRVSVQPEQLAVWPLPLPPLQAATRAGDGVGHEGVMRQPQHELDLEQRPWGSSYAGSGRPVPVARGAMTTAEEGLLPVASQTTSTPTAAPSSRQNSLKRKAVPALHPLEASASTASTSVTTSTAATAVTASPPHPPRRQQAPEHVPTFHAARHVPQRSLDAEIVFDLAPAASASAASAGAMSESGAGVGVGVGVGVSLGGDTADRNLGRRDTDPTMAIDPDVTPARTAIALPPDTGAAYTYSPYPLSALDPRGSAAPAATRRSEDSPASRDSRRSGGSRYTDTSRDLFFSTPIQSPTSSDPDSSGSGSVGPSRVVGQGTAPGSRQPERFLRTVDERAGALDADLPDGFGSGAEADGSSAHRRTTGGAEVVAGRDGAADKEADSPVLRSILAREGRAGRAGRVGGSGQRKSGEVRSMMASLYRITRDAGVDPDPGRLGLVAEADADANAGDDVERLDVRASGVSGVSGVSEMSGMSEMSRTSAYSLDSLVRSDPTRQSRQSRESMERRGSRQSAESGDLTPRAMIRALPLPPGANAGGAGPGVGSSAGAGADVGVRRNGAGSDAETVNVGRRYRGGVI